MARAKVVEAPKGYPSRAGRTAVSLYLEHDLHYTLSRLAMDEGSSLQALGEEAMRLLLRERGARVRKAPEGYRGAGRKETG